MKGWLKGGSIALLLSALIGLGGWKLHKSRSYQLFGGVGAAGRDFGLGGCSDLR